jgi:hypothetical protein
MFRYGGKEGNPAPENSSVTPLFPMLHHHKYSYDPCASGQIPLFLTLLTIIQNTSFSQEVVRTSSKSFFDTRQLGYKKPNLIRAWLGPVR